MIGRRGLLRRNQTSCFCSMTVSVRTSCLDPPGRRTPEACPRRAGELSCSPGFALIHWVTCTLLQRNDLGVATFCLLRSTEFVIADLALATYSVPSFTLASLAILSHVLEKHPPSVIVTEASFLPHLLELIYDSNESEHHTIVVVGDMATAKLPRVQNVKILKWDDVETQGATADKLALPTPGEPCSVRRFACC